jgi:hypothetical protein
MKRLELMGKYPINELEVAKVETTFNSVDEIIAYLKEQIDTHPVAGYIATFDHYEHTKSLAEKGEINSNIIGAKNIICCFGKQLTSASMLAVRPRSIGVVEYQDSFIVSFMDAPNPQAHDVMIGWVKSIVNK